MSKNKKKYKVPKPVKKPIENNTEAKTLLSEERIDHMMEELKHDVEELKQDVEVSEEIPETVIESTETKKEKPNSTKLMLTKLKEKGEQRKAKGLAENEVAKLKLFFVSDMDEEVQYLHTMSVQGYHFKAKHGIQYIFEKDEPKNYYYHLGYYEVDKRDGERYVDNYVEAGWDDIYQEKGEFDGVWNYFRTEAPDGAKAPQIFSDKVSRMALYNRLMSSWRSLIIMILGCLLFMVFLFSLLVTHPTSMQRVFITLWSMVFVILLLTMFTYMRTYRKISNKLTELKY